MCLCVSGAQNSDCEAHVANTLTSAEPSYWPQLSYREICMESRWFWPFDKLYMQKSYGGLGYDLPHKTLKGGLLSYEGNKCR